MYFKKIDPHPALTDHIVYYWLMRDDNMVPKVDKIIPDGFTELIFHFGDAYRIGINGSWSLQEPDLLAGQISRHFYLENTGRTNMVAIKLKPAALTLLFGLDMTDYTNRVVGIQHIEHPGLQQLRNLIQEAEDEHVLKTVLDNYFMLRCKAEHHLVTAVTAYIIAQNGLLKVKEMTAFTDISERQLERLFKRYVGLSPKYYARIIRFSYIFELIGAGKSNWMEIVYHSGYYDQSHFIRDFKAFTGEDPSAYFFEAQNMANFFLRK